MKNGNKRYKAVFYVSLLAAIVSATIIAFAIRSADNDNLVRLAGCVTLVAVFASTFFGVRLKAIGR